MRMLRRAAESRRMGKKQRALPLVLLGPGISSITACVLLFVAALAAAAAASARGRAQSPTCAMLANNNTFQLSYEGSWSYVTVDPETNPSGMGAIGYRIYSDWYPQEPLFENPMTFVPSANCSMDPTATGTYVWRPDYVRTKSLCGELDSIDVTTTTWYQTPTQICTEYSIHARSSQEMVFYGKVPQHGEALVSNASVVGRDVWVQSRIKSDRAPYHADFQILWAIQSSLDGTPQLAEDGSYSWAMPIMPDATITIAFCVTEFTVNGTTPAPIPYPHTNMSDTTKAIDAWLAEAPAPPSQTMPTMVTYYTAWFQFWFNTERAGGQFWVKPIITPSMSHYSRGMWLWDTGFHVFALLTGGPKALQKAKDQLTVLLSAGKQVGHIPRVVGADETENTTQPPGILTWAALVVYKRTRDKTFLQLAYDSFSANNKWFYTARASPLPDLCMWEGTDSGWDNSPRWDLGAVQAVDLNNWLYMDQAFLSEIAQELGDASGAKAWLQKAQVTKDAIQQYLWDADTTMFWDRLPEYNSTSHYRSVVTPAALWSLLSVTATKAQATLVTQTLFTAENLLTSDFFPCVGRSEKTFDPTNYWRGPVWINVNWLAAIGLDCYGFTNMAARLRSESTKLITLHPTPREYYNPLTGGGLGAYNFMWTGALFIVIEQESLGNDNAVDVLRSVLPCPA